MAKLYGVEISGLGLEFDCLQARTEFLHIMSSAQPVRVDYDYGSNSLKSFTPKMLTLSLYTREEEEPQKSEGDVE